LAANEREWTRIPNERIIAERTLEIRKPDGIIEKLLVRMAAPVEVEDGCHLCWWEFDTQPYQMIRHAAGIDGFQAIQLAMRMIGVNLWCLARDKGYEITFEGSRDLGFPDYHE
jgi:hypothetical protein